MNAIKRGIDKDGCFVVSTATLRSQDLLPKFASVLWELAPAEFEKVCPQLEPAVKGMVWKAEDDKWWRGDECAELEEVLFNALNEHAPEGFHFGSHEGDGACFGFWPNEYE